MEQKPIEESEVIKRTKRNKKTANLLTFVIDENDRLPRRIARFLHWAAEDMPGRFIEPNIIARIACNLKHTPKLDSLDVRKVKNAMGGAKKILLAEYHSSLKAARGIGYRATFDDTDLAQQQLETDAANIVRGVERMEVTRSAIRINKINDPAVRARVVRLSGVVKKLTSAEVLEKLRLPSPAVDKKPPNNQNHEK